MRSPTPFAPDARPDHRGARPAGRGHRARVRRRPRSHAFTHERARRVDRGGRSARRRPPSAPTSSSTARPTTTWTRRRASRSRARGQRVRRAGAGPRRACRAARRSSTTAPTSCSTARPIGPYTEDDQPESAAASTRVEAAGRVVRDRGAARTTCCASRACSAAGARRAAAAASARSSSGSGPARSARVRGSHGLAELSADVARPRARCSNANAAPGLYHCVNTGAATWLGLADASCRGLESGRC